MPAYECWLALVVPVCYLREFKGDNHMPIDALYYDVLPPTLEGFLALGSKGDGGLGQAWDPRFPSLRDADGDGLLSTAYNGLDPNDSAADGDGDGLTDRFEVEQRAGGAVISPILRDTDADGLTDWQELQLGTDPGAADGDSDGLKDGEEVAHLKFDPDTGLPTTTWEGGWSVTINAAVPFTVRVSSDPGNTDGDADGISDLSERQLAADPNPANRVDSLGRPYHPNLFNSPPLAVIVQTDDLDDIVAPGQSLRYTTTAIASTAMVPGVLNLNAPPFLGGPRNPTAVAFDPQTLCNRSNRSPRGSASPWPQARERSTRLSPAPWGRGCKTRVWRRGALRRSSPRRRWGALQRPTRPSTATSRQPFRPAGQLQPCGAGV